MATITTSTTGAYGWPPNTFMDIQPGTSNLWVLVRTGSTTMSLYKSTDLGVSWSSAQGTITVTGLYDISDMFIDPSGQQIFVTYLVNSGGNDAIYFRRWDIQTGSAATFGHLLIATGAAASARAFWYSSSLVAVKNPDNTYAIVIGGCFHQATYSGVIYYGVSIKNDPGLTTYLNNGILLSTRQYRLANDDSNGITCSMDIEHNGDGHTASTPNIWSAFQIHDRSWVLKFTWKGYKTGWSTPGAATNIANGRPAVRDNPARWDGERFVILSTRPSDLTRFDVWERNRANTSTITRTTPSHPGGNVQSAVVTFNHVTKDIRIYAAGSGTNVLVYYVDYIRATNTWGSWTTSGISPVTSEFGTRRGTYGTYQYDLYWETGTSPWTVQNTIGTVNFAPTIPSWITGTAGTLETNGAAFDVADNLTLDWAFNDPNAADTQSKYALSRQIGNGTVQWWRTSDSTWQVVETQNTSGTTQLTLTPAQWVGAGGASDPTHGYRVKTWDQSGLPSPDYSQTLILKPSTRVNPTLTRPTASAILNAGVCWVEWTVADQSAYRITITNSVTTAKVYDSGWKADPGGLTAGDIPPVVLPDGFAGTVTLQTRNGYGLPSLIRSAAFTVDFVEPVTPTVTTLQANPNAGGITVGVTQPAATGTQPASYAIDIYRRKALAGTTTPVNTNPYFETNTTDWQIGEAYATAVRSTAFAHSGVASVLLTPNGTTPTPNWQTSTRYSTTPGALWGARAWARSTTANKNIRIRLQWYTGTTLIGELIRDVTPVAGVWVYAWIQGAAPDLTDGVRISIGQSGTPAAGDTLYVDEVGLYRGNSDNGTRIISDATSGATYVDWRAVGGVDYEYRATADATNGTNTLGPWLA